MPQTCSPGTGSRTPPAACLARWPRAVCPAREIIPAWERLAAACEKAAA